jgi:plastocyanin
MDGAQLGDRTGPQIGAASGGMRRLAIRLLRHERIDLMSHRSTRRVRAGRTLRLTAALAGACGALALGALGTSVAQAASTLPTISATVSPTAITVTGALQAGAVNVASTATGGKEPSVVLFQLKPGVSLGEVFAFLDSNKLTKDPNAADKYGTIVFDAEAAKGKASEAQTILAAGQYVAFNAEGENSAKWPRTSFAVAASAAPVALPAAQTTEKTIDFGFRGPATLKVGQLVRFENEGYLVHMNIAFPVKSKKAAKLVVKGLASGNEKALGKLVAGPPVSFAGPISTGAFQQSVITAKPGWYVQACFMPTQDGRPHTLIGMERIIKITK